METVFQKTWMTAEAKQLRDTVLGLTRPLLREGLTEDNILKMEVAEVLAMLAAAIQDGQTESLAEALQEWGSENLMGWRHTNGRPC
jgi:rhamnogalacturonyl hydrolase YesR